MWLLDHPEVERPSYLVQNGILDEKFLRQRQYTIDSDNLSTTDIPPGMTEFSPDDAKVPGTETTEKEEQPEQEQQPQ